LQQPARQLVDAGPQLLRRIEGLAQTPAAGAKTRVHGDYHLGQVLVALNDFVIIDFEGDPTRSDAEQRSKQSVLRDVAGMLRSFARARYTATLNPERTPEQQERLRPAAQAWEEQVRAAFLDAYADAAVKAGVFSTRAQFDAARGLLDLFELDRAFHELRIELGHSPQQAAAPLACLVALAAQTPAT
jgi:maltose alpha-D-glucosyltransferase/alpha-amylase